MGERKQSRVLRWSWGKLAMVVSWAIVGGLAFYLGRVCFLPQAEAAAGHAGAVRSQDPPQGVPAMSAEYSRNVVGYIHGTTPITREELGEYLIARQGAERLELLINRRIIDVACQQVGITVTPQEMDVALADDLKSLNCDLPRFVNSILKQYGKTLYEWKEDVIRPKLMLNKLCRSRIKVEEGDLQHAFEALYGEKIEGRIVLWPKGEENVALRMYAEVRGGEEAFAKAAQQQANPSLAATGGKIRPIGHFTTGCPELETAVFRLQPGEMTELIGTPEGTVAFKCDKRIPADTTKKFEDVRGQLEQEVSMRKSNVELGKVFQELRAQAKPVNLLKPDGPSPAEREAQAQADAEQVIKEDKMPLPKMGVPLPTKDGAPMPGGQ